MNNTNSIEGNCKNCNHLITENFCGNCGQKKYKRIDQKYILDELQYSLLHTNKGFFYSVKKIMRNPGKAAREFIDGNRVNHYKPILLVFLLSGIAAFVSFKLVGLDAVMETYYKEQNISQTIIDFLSPTVTYSSFFMLLLLPIFAGFTKIAFWKWGHNYFEHIIMNAFFQVYYTIINIVLVYPLLYLIKDDPSLTMIMVMVSMLIIVPIVLVWFFRNFYPEKKTGQVILRVMFIGLLLFVLYIISIILLFLGLAIFSPETFKNMSRQ